MIVVVTEAHVRSWRVYLRFVRRSVASMAQARGAPGNLGARVHLRGFWVWCTVSGWRDEAALSAYVRSGPHLEAMRETGALLSGSVFARRTHEGPLSTFSWPMARAALDGADRRALAG